MNWKDDLKHILIGVPMLWLFMLLGGGAIYLLQAFYWVWLILIFVVAPVVLYIAPTLHERYKKGRST